MIKLIDGKPYISIPLKRLLSESRNTYKDIAARIDPEFLKQKIRANSLKKVELAGIQEKSMIFYVESAKFIANQTTYTNVFRFKDWDSVIDDATAPPVYRARLLIGASDLDLHCTCPSFLYWGYQYILTKRKAALSPEKRPPVKRNPRQRGIVCKHLNKSLKAFPFHASDLAKYIRENHKVAMDKTATRDKITDKLKRVIKEDEEMTYEDFLEGL